MDVKDRESRWKTLLADPTCSVLVAKAEGQILGFISYGTHRDEHYGPDAGEIWTMYVHPKAWRGGVGKTLMREALSALERAGYSEAWVWVLAKNPQAIAFYKSCGFALLPQSLRTFRLGEQELEEVALARNAA